MLLNRCLLKLECWLSFGNIVAQSQTSVLEPYVDDTAMTDFQDFLGSTYSVWTSGTSTEQSHATKLLQEIYRKYYSHYCFALRKEFGTDSQMVLDDEFNEKLIHLRTMMTNIFFETKDRYLLQLSLYTSEKSKLLDGVKTTTTGVGRFNDTPQNITNGDEFGDNTHISNITKSTAEAVSDVDTKMARLDEISRRYRNLLKDWVNEFDSLFIEERNV